MYTTLKPEYIGKIPTRTDIKMMPCDTDLDRINNIISGIESHPIIVRIDESHLSYHYSISGTNYTFLISAMGEIRLYNCGRLISVEDMLDDKDVIKEAKKAVLYNLDLFTYKRQRIGWTVSEAIGIGAYNPKGLAKLNVTTSK